MVAELADDILVMYAGRAVEYGRADDIFGEPQHPYTWGLLGSMPRLDRERAERLLPIPGTPPSLINVPPGCPFHPRCAFGELNDGLSETEVPQLRDVGGSEGTRIGRLPPVRGEPAAPVDERDQAEAVNGDEQVTAEPDQATPPPASRTGEELLAVSGLQKHFPVRRGLLQRKVGAVQAVDGLDFTVLQGETLSLVGESGCGKTTTGRLITRLLEPTAGSIVFEGRDISHISSGKMRPLRRDVQMIFQDPYSSLNPRHTVGTIVGAPFKLQKVKTEHGVKRAVQELLELVGLSPEHYNRYPHEFSGGQRQRIGIARTLALRPKLIVADEPVSALDVSIQAQVVNLLEDLQNELDLTYVMIAHDLSVVRHVSDRVAVMYLGKIVELADRTRPVRAPDAPVHGGAAVGGAGPRHRAAAQPRAHPADRRRAEPDQPAAGVPLPHPVLEGAGDLLDASAAAGRAGAGPPGGLPLPREPGAAHHRLLHRPGRRGARALSGGAGRAGAAATRPRRAPPRSRRGAAAPPAPRSSAGHAGRRRPAACARPTRRTGPPPWAR